MSRKKITKSHTKEQKSGKQTPSKQAPGKQQLKIIGGQWRSRVLPFPDIDGLRPTGSRIRETLFNWLGESLHKASVLDLFAGSGALGFEALSRGADSIQFVEANRLAASQLKENCTLLGLDTQVVNQDEALRYLSKRAIERQSTEHQAPDQYNLVFIDPPFAEKMWHDIFEALETTQCLSPHALIYVEAPTDEMLITPQNWQCIKDKRSGRVNYRLYQRAPE